MTQPPAEGRDPGAEPGRGTPPGRDPRLAGFASGGTWDGCSPSAALTAVAEGVSGPGWRCPGATDDELDGLLGRWAAIESWASAAKLGVVREKIRRAEQPGPHGGVQSSAIERLAHEVALTLAVSVRNADKTGWLALQLGERLPGIGALLADGTLTQSKAAMLAAELSVLSDADAAAAEALIIGRVAGQTHGQLGRLAAQAACTVDPDGAQKRRKAAERDDARVRLWREQSGTAALAGTGLPSDEALAAFANVTARATEYEDSGALPDARMDQLRVMAYLDLLNAVPAADRIARAIALARAEAAARAESESESEGEGRGEGTDDRDPGRDNPGRGDPGRGDPGRDDPGRGDPGRDDPGPDEQAGDPAEGGPGSDGGGGRPGGSAPSPVPSPVPSPAPGPAPSPEPGSPRRPARQDLIIPLRTLLGLADRPGEGHNLGPLDPGLARDLAAAAALSPRSEWCVTVTDSDGIAVGHGCGRITAADRAEQPPGPPGAPGAGLPARVNLTIPLSALPGLLAPRGRPGYPARPGRPWGFGPRGHPGPPGGYGIWTLTLPGGRQLTVRLEPVPAYECDHRHESRAYQPNGTLRHLVQVRDGECTFPSCSRPARESDFEHAIPYDQGGRTCACNAGARSRACHRVKQSPGWNLTQPKPGWHQWTTPSGRVYTQGPKRYPA